MFPISLILMILMFFSGCASVPASHTEVILPDQDDGLGGTGIESDDVRTVGRKMAVSTPLGINLALRANRLAKSNWSCWDTANISCAFRAANHSSRNTIALAKYFFIDARRACSTLWASR